MFTFQGISVDSYVTFERECRVSCAVNGPEIEIVLGHSAGSLHLVTNEDGFTKLKDLLNQIHTQLTTPGAPTVFQLPNPA